MNDLTAITPRESAQSSGSVQGPALSSAAFQRIATVARREAGLAIPEGKSAMVRTRLARRLRALNLDGFDAYCDLIDRSGNEELGLMISALTTNVSHFFREPHHFDILRDQVVPVLEENARLGRTSRIWSAGCANGQEPYSIAMVLHEAGVDPAKVKVLATDIDPVVIATARRGVYADHMVTGLPDDRRARYLDASKQGDARVMDDLRAYISFNTLNLLEPWPMKKQFDAIFCRNVVIYFDKQTQSELWQRYADMLHPNAWLFLGHSERIDTAADTLFEKAGITAYKRRANATSFSRKET